MEILYIKKRNKEIVKLDQYIIDSNFSNNIKQNDFIIFKCVKCSSVGSRKKSKFDLPLLEEHFVCKSCLCSSVISNQHTIEKRKQTNLERYGVENCFQSKSIKEKIKQTNLEKYGFDNPMKNIDIKNKSLRLYKEKFYNNFIIRNNNLVKPLFTIEEYIKVSIKYKWECLQCGNVFEDNVDNGKIPKCLKCFPHDYKSSNKEKEIEEFINSLGLKYIKNHRIENKEIDIFIPEKNFGIEFDGLYWHSDEFKSNDYHYNKTNLFKEKGIDIIHVFEDEWDYKKEIVKSIIKSRLNIYDNIIYARKCEIRNVNREDEISFLQENHIQGYVGSSTKIGLYFENKLVSLMTIGVSRFNKNYRYELLRFANKLNTKVIGGASKLFKHLKITNIISYCDIRYFTGTLYEILGLTFKNSTTPNYYYIKGNNRFNRIKFQKHKLVNLLENFDEKLTEKENMKNNGYNIIYDCGVKVFALE